MSGDHLREVGKIGHAWDRDLVSFTTNITFPELAVQPKYKALILAAAFLLVSFLVHLLTYILVLMIHKSKQTIEQQTRSNLDVLDFVDVR